MIDRGTFHMIIYLPLITICCYEYCLAKNFSKKEAFRYTYFFYIFQFLVLFIMILPSILESFLG